MPEAFAPQECIRNWALFFRIKSLYTDSIRRLTDGISK